MLNGFGKQIFYPLQPKRLAYEEHILKEQQEGVFFKEDADFYEKLKTVILKFPFESQANFGRLVKKYDWKVIINKYDEALEF